MMQDLFVITAPPASGKTFWIASFKKIHPMKQILVISPLRALADECKNNWGDSIIVMTPEEWLGKKIFCDIVIFDEFHLNFYWGDTFRPLMWEVFFELSQKSLQTFLLTATMSTEMQLEISNFSTQFDRILWFNHGNQILKNKPSLYVKAPNKDWILDQIESELPGMSVKLIFCQFRNEVMALEKKLSEKGYSCISCVGGESKLMAQKIKLNKKPDYIISTTVLSHGVNLPDISKIFFLYQIKNLDFWIQMVARGGRRGEAYQVFGLDSPEGLVWSSWQNFINLLWLSLKQKFSPILIFLSKT